VDPEAGEGADLLRRRAATRDPVTDGEFRSHPGTELPSRPLVGPGSGRSALGAPSPVVEAAAYVGALRGGSDMTGAILIVLAVLVLALSAIAIIYVLGIGSKSSRVRNAARRFHHGVGNPLQLRSAGTPGTGGVASCRSAAW
jgi:hypothetical protein